MDALPKRTIEVCEHFLNVIDERIDNFIKKRVSENIESFKENKKYKFRFPIRTEYSHEEYVECFKKVDPDCVKAYKDIKQHKAALKKYIQTSKAILASGMDHVVDINDSDLQFFSLYYDEVLKEKK